VEFESIVKSYLDRNYTTTFVDRYPVWKVRKTCESEKKKMKTRQAM